MMPKQHRRPSRYIIHSIIDFAGRRLTVRLNAATTLKKTAIVTISGKQQ